jgi:hypothetical protein
MSRRKLNYGNDWFDTLHSELRVPVEPRVPIEPMTVIYPQMAPCPPGYKYRPKRKPGQRKCTKETVKSVLSFLQMLATQNRISIFKLRKDKKGYTRTLLTIPQLKSRLTRHGISYKNNQFGMQSLDATSRAMRRSALRSGNAPYTSVYSEISDLTSRNPGRTSEAARGSAILVSAVRAAQIAEMRAAAARMREMVEARRAAARARYREQQLTGRGGSGDFEDTTSTRAIEFGRIMRFGMEAPRRSISDSRNVRRDSEDALREMWNLRRNRVRERMRREIAGDIIFPDRPWHRAAPPYATTIQRYARGMIARNMN